MNTSSFPPPLPLRMLFPPPPQIQCHRYSAGLAALPTSLLRCAVCATWTSPTCTRLLFHSQHSHCLWARNGKSCAQQPTLPPCTQEGANISAGVPRLPGYQHATLWWGNRAYGQRQSWEVLTKLHEQKLIKNNMALASHDTLHSSLLQTSWNYPWKARLLSLWLPATPKTHCKLTRKGKLVPKQKTKKPAKHAQHAFSSRHLCLCSTLHSVVTLEAMEEVGSALCFCTKTGGDWGTDHLPGPTNTHTSLVWAKGMAAALEAGSTLNQRT